MDDDQKEVLKVGAEAALRPFADLIEKLFGGVSEQIGGMWEDSLAVQRQIRRLHLFKKLQAVIDDAGFEPQRIPDSIWVPALREAVLQDDESLQERWANLLANASDPRQINPVRPSFAQILKEFTPLDARFLDELYKRVSSISDRPPFSGVITSRDLVAAYSHGSPPHLRTTKLTDHDEKGGNPKTESSELATTIDVLLRHRILGESTSPDPIDVSKIVSDSKWTRGMPRSIEATVTTGYHITALGIGFVKACQVPDSARPA
jgi:hypothetical protein